MKVWSTCFVWCLAFSLGSCQRSEAPERPRTLTAPSTTVPTEVAGLRYLVATSGGAEARDVLPLLVVAHGLGDQPSSMIRLLRPLQVRLRIVALEAPRPYHGGFSWFPLELTGDSHEAMVQGIREQAQRVATALEQLRVAFPTTGKPMITGFSQGGMLSFAVALHHPEVVSAAIPLSGWLPSELVPSTRPPGVTYPPIRAFHGDADPLLPVGPTRMLAERLQQLGYPIAFESYPGLAHHIHQQELRDVESAIVELSPR